MKKKFIARNKKKKTKIKIFFFFVLFILGVILSFRYLWRSGIAIGDKTFVQLLIRQGNSISEVEGSLFQKVIQNILKTTSTPAMLLESNYQEVVHKTDKTVATTVTPTVTPSQEPLIYIYNSHQTEEYKPSSFAEYNVNPTVMMGNYILEDVFEKNQLPTLVEERRIKDVLNQNQWKYVYSYRASRVLMEQAKQAQASLVYFIDVHRDSLPRDKTTVEINGKSYAKTIFLIGLENANYQENLNFTTQINDKLNQKYPNLSKGIYKKGGEGVNGVYNQDFSPYTILIEIGGPENTTSEVLNSALAFADCFMEVIGTHEG